MQRKNWSTTEGQLKLIGRREPIRNIGQCEGLHVNIYVSLQANLGFSEVGSPFIMLANAKACMEIFMSDCGPTWDYWKWGAHLQHWPMQRPVCKYLWVTMGQLELIKSGEPIHNVGQCRGLCIKTDQLLGANSSSSEIGSPFTTLAHSKVGMRILVCSCRPTQSHRKWTLFTILANDSPESI
jgi:hypothetical protein